MRRAYIINQGVNPTSLPFVFDGARSIRFPNDGTGYVEVDGSLPGGTETTLRSQPKVVPQEVSPRQIRQALSRANLRTQVESAVAAGNQDLKDWWEFSTVFERNHSQVVSMGTALNQTSTQLDDLFILAASLI